MPDYSSAFTPATNNLQSAVMGGINSGREWAQAKMLNQYRQAELQRQQQQMENQMAQHKLMVMEKSSGNWLRIAQTEPEKRPPLVKWAQQQDAMMGIDSSGIAKLAKDPNFFLDVANPLAKGLKGLKNGGDPQAIAQAYQGMQNAMADPIQLREFAATASRATAGLDKQTLGIAQHGNEARATSQFKHDLGPAAGADQKTQQKAVQTYQFKMNADLKKVDDKIQGIDEAFDQFDQAAKNNPAAVSAAGTTFAKAIMTGQRLTNPELKNLSPMAASWYQKAQSWFDKGAEGSLPGFSLDAGREVLNGMSNIAQQRKYNIQNQYAGQLASNLKMDPHDAFNLLTNKAFKEEDKTDSASSKDASPSGLQSLDPEKRMQAEAYIKAHSAAGTDPKSMRDSLEKGLGTKLSDDDFNQLNGSPQSAAPAAAAAPSIPSMIQRPADQVDQAPAVSQPNPSGGQP